MSITLYDAIVPTFDQTLGAMIHLLKKAEAHCAEKGVAPADIVGRASSRICCLSAIR